MPFKWNLKMIMAKKNIWTGDELKRLLGEKSGLQISSAGISRLLSEDQTKIKLVVLDALCNALDCRPDELLVQTAADALKEKDLDQKNA